MRDEILRALPRSTRRSANFHSVFWADIVRGRQQEYLLYARTSTRFYGGPLHKLVIEGLGDAAAYQKTWERVDSAYYQIQSRLKRTLSEVTLGEDDARPLVFIAHSLGCHIVSSFAWDVHKLKLRSNFEGGADARKDVFQHRPYNDRDYSDELQGKSRFERLDTFAGFITMGSNMPLFTFALGPKNVHPISRSQNLTLFDPAFPGSALEPYSRAQSRWLNYYSVNDPLGYPLKPLNDAYDDEPLLSDISVASEGWLRALFLRGRLRQLNALSAHNGYWSNRKVIRGAARLINDLANAEKIWMRSKKSAQVPT